MQSQLWSQQDGTYYADFMYDDAPRGFEDHWHDSMFVKRLQNGTALAEYNRPDVTQLTNSDSQALVRYCTIEERNVCGYIKAHPLGNEGFRLTLHPYGPLKDTMVTALSHNATGYGLYIRYLTSNDDDMDEVVTRIDTADFIKL